MKLMFECACGRLHEVKDGTHREVITAAELDPRAQELLATIDPPRAVLDIERARVSLRARALDPS